MLFIFYCPYRDKFNKRIQAVEGTIAELAENFKALKTDPVSVENPVIKDIKEEISSLQDKFSSGDPARIHQ